LIGSIKGVMPSDAFKNSEADLLYELVVQTLCLDDDKLCLMTIARWYHSFPSRTGQ
jgi:hypothetical protein